MASHSPVLPTVYGRVIVKLADGFVAAGHAVTVIGMGDSRPSRENYYRLVPIGTQAPEDTIARLIAIESPDILFTLGDPWMFELVPQIADLCTTTWISYLALDGYPLPPEWANWIASCDIPVVFSAWAQSLVAQATKIRPEMIPHGVDTALFAPGDKAAAKAALGIDPDTFVVGCVAANQQRKNLPALIRAFALFATSDANAVLYLHTQSHGFWDIPQLLGRFGIGSKSRLTRSTPDGQVSLSDAELVRLYNAFDLFCLPTMAEGFGLPVLESQACGVPALVTDFSASSELVANPVQLLGVKGTLVMNRGLEQAVVDVTEIAAKLDYFYHRRQDLPLLGRQCRRFAEPFDWSVVLPKFLRLIESAPAKPKEASLRFFAI
jgi:glycosyltransferase involved in cell wall biosynthesis